VRFRPRRHHLVRRAKNESGASLSIVRRSRLHSTDGELFFKAFTAAVATLDVADALQRARLSRVSTNIANPKTIADRFTQLRIVNRPPSILNLLLPHLLLLQPTDVAFVSVAELVAYPRLTVGRRRLSL
jgi:hypothetical protein